MLAVELIDRQKDWPEPLADSVQNAVRGAFKAGGETGQQVENFLHGAWMGPRCMPL